jgi:predicted metal-dependent hydrolase
MSSAKGTSIPVRRMDFAFPADLPKYWFRGNPWITHFLNGLSSVFPDGERFFIQSVRNYQDRIEDPQLLREVRAFIGQEANHGKEHEAFNKLLEESHGVPTSAIARYTRRGLALAQKRLPKAHQLAMTLALEHFTAVLANQLLQNPEIMEELHSAYGDLFLWHAVEETEHKAVAYDVYQQVDGRYWVRAFAMARTTIMFLGHQMAFTLWLVARDGKLADVKSFLGFLRFLWLEPGPMRRIIPEYLDYYRRDFHPWDHDNRALIAERVEQLRNKELRAA